MVSKAKANTKVGADRSVADLRSNPGNPRRITLEAMARLGKAMREFGDLSGVVFNRRTGHLVGGHQRASQLDPSWKIVQQPAPDDVGTVALGWVETPFGRWTYREVDWPEKREKAANVAANKHGGEFDMPLLKDVLQEIDDGQFDMDLTGFDVDELEDLMTAEFQGQTNADEIPAARPTKIKRGDLFELGKHRLLCGDSTKAGDVGRVMDGEKPLLMVTDPPYGVSLDQGWRDRRGLNGLGRAQDDLLAGDDTADWREAWKLSPSEIAYVWSAAGALQLEAGAALQAADFELRQQIVWVKSMAPMSRSAYHWKHEPCWYAIRKGATAHWCGGHKETTAWEAASPKHIMGGSHEEKEDHPTQKPIEIFLIPIRNHEGDVYDPFLGPGTTLIAAEQLGRRCYGIEIEPRYCQVIVDRWEKFAGKKAKKVDSGCGDSRRK